MKMTVWMDASKMSVFPLMREVNMRADDALPTVVAVNTLRTSGYRT